MLIVKNTTGTLISIKETGEDIPASGQRTIDASRHHMYQKEATITEMTTNINSGALVINDGINDLSATKAFAYLRQRFAEGIRFKSNPERLNDFISKDVQLAIEEVRSISDPLIVPINLIYNGTLSNGNWIGYSNLLPGDNTPIIVPISGTFTGFTWSNNDTGPDFALEFSKTSTVTSPFFTWTVVNTQTANVTLPTPQAVTAGEKFFVKYIDQGGNAADAAIVLKFKA